MYYDYSFSVLRDVQFNASLERGEKCPDEYN